MAARRRRASRRERGSTLIEMMTVVAILGVMGSMAGVGFRDLVRTNRVVGASKGLVAAFRGARLRAAAANCPFYVQVNGPSYAVTPVAGFASQAGTLTMLRKGNCTSTKLAFEVGDIVVDSAMVVPDGTVDAVLVDLPAAVLTAQTLTNQSFTVGYAAQGARGVWLDATGAGDTGFAEVTALADLTLSLHENDSAPRHLVSLLVPSAGGPRMQ